jgi:hypothetical protein
MLKNLVFNPNELSETIAHSSLSDMPDVGGTNTDHDLRYWTLATSQTGITGDKAGSFNLTTAGILSGGADTDTTHILGKAKIGFPATGTSDYAYFGHYDCFADDSSYALAQGASGNTFLNSKAGQSISIVSGGNTVETITSSLISHFRPTTINTNSTAALRVEQDGVKDDVLVVDTTNGKTGFNLAPSSSAYSPVIIGGTNNLTLYSTGNYCSLLFADGYGSAAEYAGMLRYTHTTDLMEIYAGAASRVQINSTGVGIGITPAVALDVDSNSSSQCIRARGLNQATDWLSIYDNANGGVVEVSAHAGTYGYLSLCPNNSTEYGVIIFKHGTNSGGIFTNIVTNDAAVDYTNITCCAANSTLGLTIDANQNVGIGCQASAPSTAVTANLVCQPHINNAKFELIEDINNLVGTSNIKGFWIFDQTGATTTITDRSPNAHDITLGGNASTLSPAVSGLCPNLTMAGTAATSWSACDSNDFSFGNGAGVDSAFTIVVLTNSTTTTNVMLGKRITTSHCEWELAWSANKLYFGVLSADVSKYRYRYYNTAISTDAGSWHCYIGTASGGSPQASVGLKLYRDGSQIDDTTLTSAGDLYAGMTAGDAVVANSRNNASVLSSGKYGVVAIISKELTADETKRVSNRLLAYAGQFV